MKKTIVFLLILMALGVGTQAQQFMTRTGFISFYSKAPLEDITAENNQVYAIVDVTKKNIAFTLLLRGFIFPKELMQEHFNENYVESDKYPKAIVSGAFTGDVLVNKEGVYQIVVKGTLSLHNVTKPIEVPATLEVKGGKLVGHAQFKIKPEDYNIQIPSVVRDKIASEVVVTVKVECNNIN
jgi:polyisoprenoid-binding protein YceI